MNESTLRIFPTEVPNQLDIQGRGFPAAWRCDSSDAPISLVADWICRHRGELIDQSADSGAVVFRGFPVHNASDFDAFVASFGLENFPYDQSLSNAVRVNYTPRVFSANEAPAEVRILLHHEMAQTPIFPSKLFFFCEAPAEEGGATPLCRSDELFATIQREFPEFASRCENLGLKYTNVMPGGNDAGSGMGRSWQSTLRATDRDAAERTLSHLGYSWEWLADGCLRATTPRLPAVRKLNDGRKTFFNQLIAAFQGWKDSRNDPSKSITFGDGTRLDPDVVHTIVGLADRFTFEMNWRHGDVVLVDNIVTMHGRRTFRGKRRVLASLIEAQRHAWDNSSTSESYV